MIGIINYGVGNIGSIANMIKKIGHQSVIINEPAQLENVEKIILPGVGSFDTGMQKMKELNIIEPLHDFVFQQKKPILGICLGMQLMLDSSEEGQEKGLGFIDGYVKKFQFENNTYKIPHMGWNLIDCKKESKLFADFYAEPRFYFVHSYHAVLNHQEDILATAKYGYEFTCCFEKNNIIGTQFHPEKSHKFGMKLLKNFIENF